MKSPHNKDTSSDGAQCKMIHYTTLHVNILISWLFFFVAHLTMTQMFLLLYDCVCACLCVTGGGRWGNCRKDRSVGNCLRSMCVGPWLNKVYQAGALAIVVQRYCCSISHSTPNNGIFPLQFAIAVGGAKLYPIHPPDCPRMQKPF